MEIGKPADTEENTLYLYLSPPVKRNPLIPLSSNQGEPKHFFKKHFKETFQFKFNLSPNLNPNLNPTTLSK